jgi:hypothetical protein
VTPCSAFRARLPPSGIVIYPGKNPGGKATLLLQLRGGTRCAWSSIYLTRTRFGPWSGCSSTASPWAIRWLRALGEGPDGYLYFGTTNRDGRGKHDPENDRIFCLFPPTRMTPGGRDRRRQDECLHG